jgi:hypothetical protein
MTGKLVILCQVIPVEISAQPLYGAPPVKTKDLLYIVEELTYMFVSRDALVDLGSISTHFPCIPCPTSYGFVTGIQGSSADTVVEEPCIKPSSFSSMVADCGCPVRREVPEPPPLPFSATEENKTRLKEFLVNTYRASTFNTCQH